MYQQLAKNDPFLKKQESLWHSCGSHVATYLNICKQSTHLMVLANPNLPHPKNWLRTAPVTQQGIEPPDLLNAD